MIKVLHIVDKLSVGDSTIHGVTRLLSWWLPRFDKDRYDVLLCSFRKRDKAGEYLESLGIKTYYLNKSKFDPLTILELLRLIKNERIDILHLHGYGAATFGRICSIIKGIPCIVHEHMYDINIPSYQRLADFILSKFSDRAIAVSKSVKEFLVTYRFFTEKSVDVIYNGAPLDVIINSPSSDSTPPDKNLRSILNIPQKMKIITIVGRLHPVKGHSYFIDAAKQILTEYKNVKFLIVGDGELLDDLQEQCKKEEISEDVIFTGYSDNVFSFLYSTDIKIISSLSEGVPLTLFEAMAAKCAIIATDVGGLGEIIIDGQTGFLVPSRNPQAIAEKALLLLKNPDLLYNMANRSQIESTRFDIANTVRKFENYYEKIL